MIDPLEPRQLFASAFVDGINLNDEATSDTHFAFATGGLQRLGVTSVRLYMTIDDFSNRPLASDIEPPPDSVDLKGNLIPSGQGRIIRRAFQLKHLGHHVLLSLVPRDGKMPRSATEVTAFIQYLMNVTEQPNGGQRLRDVVDGWEIGNEPDSQTYWNDPSSNKSTRLKSYVDKFLLPAAAALHSGKSSAWAKVVSGGVSYSPEDLKTILSYLTSKGKINAIDFAGFHPYATPSQQRSTILLAKQYADSFGKKLIASEWSVRGFSNTGSDASSYAAALDTSFRKYILPNFQEAYYFCGVNNWAVLGGTVSARPGGVFKHISSVKVTPTSNKDLISDFYASTITDAEPFFSTVKSWRLITPTSPAINQATVNGATYWDYDGHGKINDNERLAPGQVVWLDLNGDRKRNPNEPTATSDALGIFKITIPTGLTGSANIRFASAFPQTSTAVISLASKTAQFVGVSISAMPNFGPPPRITGSITGTLFRDQNHNAILDAGDLVVANRIIYLDSNNDGVRQTSEFAVLTDTSGLFQFRKLIAGAYHVRLVPASGDAAAPRTVTIAADQRILKQNLAI